jgi:hypothetical protein
LIRRQPLFLKNRGQLRTEVTSPIPVKVPERGWPEVTSHLLDKPDIHQFDPANVMLQNPVRPDVHRPYQQIVTLPFHALQPEVTSDSPVRLDAHQFSLVAVMSQDPLRLKLRLPSQPEVTSYMSTRPKNLPRSDFPPRPDGHQFSPPEVGRSEAPLRLELPLLSRPEEISRLKIQPEVCWSLQRRRGNFELLKFIKPF